MKTWANSISQKSDSSSTGFVLLWTTFLVFPILFAGLIFLQYAKLNASKLVSQLEAMNMSIIGSFNVEYPEQASSTDESMTSMIMLANAYGFTDAMTSETPQNLSSGFLHAVHDTVLLSEHTIDVVVGHDVGLLSSLLNIFSSTVVKGISGTKAAPLYINLLLDYSASLRQNPSIGGQLQAFLPDTPQSNKYLRSLMPFGIDDRIRLVRPWLEKSANFSYPEVSTPGCTPSVELGCQSDGMSHLSSWSLHRPDLFAIYKQMAGLVASIGVLSTRHFDVNAFGGSDNPTLVNYVNTVMTGANTAGSIFYPAQGDGVYTVWRFDGRYYSNYSFDSLAVPQLTANLDSAGSWANPKSPLEDPLPLGPTDLFQLRLIDTWSRKVLQYARVLDETGAVVVPLDPPSQPWRTLLDPVVPNLQVAQKQKYSFTYQYDVSTEPFEALGWPYRPTPLMTYAGPPHPTNAELITNGMRDLWEYNCQTGPQVTNMTSSFPLPSQVPQESTTGELLADIFHDCNITPPTVAPTPIPGGGLLSIGTSPDCRDASGTSVGPPTCPTSLDPFTSSPAPNAPWCLHNQVICSPSAYSALPICPAGSSPTCDNDVSVGVTPQTWRTAPGFTDPVPVFRGKLDFPPIPPAPNDVQYGWLFAALGDLGVWGNGTRTDLAMELATQRCAEAKAFNPKMNCKVILLTDGAPNPPIPVPTGLNVMNDFQTYVNALTGPLLDGQLFTWFLGWGSRINGLDDLFQSLLSSTTPVPSASLTTNLTFFLPDVHAANSISNCTAWDSMKALVSVEFPGINFPDCNEYNNVMIPQHNQQQAAYTQFRSIVSPNPPDPNRHLTETALQIGTMGTSVLTSQAANFLIGVRTLAAQLKNEPLFTK